MRKAITALVVVMAACLAAAAAAAADPGPIQVSGQSAGTQQQAVAASSATQVNPSNTNISIRVLSPGSDGDVTQSNTAGSRADAGNKADTTQDSSQAQAGSSCGCDGSGSGIQTSDQSAATDQSAAALSEAKQIDPSNTAVSVRVLSPGDGGSVSQSNTAASSAKAGNAASTSQTGEQTQAAGKCGCASDPIQVAKQSADTEQESAALSAALQDGASNDASPVRVWSPGGGGSVDQSNSVASSAWAGNDARTYQSGRQYIAGSRCTCQQLPIQAAGQWAGTAQLAPAFSEALQLFGQNESSPASVKSPGYAGDLTQANGAGSRGDAGNRASSGQGVSQTS